MYFWRIRRFRDELKNGTLPSEDALSYALAVTFFYTILTLSFSWVSPFVESHWMTLYIAVFFATKFLGITVCFYCNGGTKGINFLERYFSLAWVQIVRFFIFGIILLVLGVFIIEIFSGQQVLKSPHYLFMAFFLLLWQVFYYWRLSLHFRYIASRP